ncbi:hypothetical protein [Streptomyces sp. ME19-01-6]|uniref:hypothetical protein n=1 Tax=Streptomyces sp. ME19-01-6 TaxID=3028686 RepID=UPI0029B2D3CA|nr:hypothetical protein [Streptomyces sp. ME19-01-6]MDX3229241.1 hypothetical protein [Streptomyces sp. ME19-01-6]
MVTGPADVGKAASRAYRIAGARLAARSHWPLARVARALADEQRKLDELAVGHIAVRAGLELTYQRMAPTTQHAPRMLALLPGPNFAPWALAALLDTGLSDAETVRDDLVEAHLVEIASAGATGFRHRLHDLVRLLGRERAEREVSRQQRATALPPRLLAASLHLADFARRLCAPATGAAPPNSTATRKRWNTSSRPCCSPRERARPTAPVPRPGRRMCTDCWPGEAQALRCLGQSHRELGGHPAAADCFRQAASISEDLGDRLGAIRNSASCGARPRRRCTRSRRHSSRPVAPDRPAVAPKPRSGCGSGSVPGPGWPSAST